MVKMTLPFSLYRKLLVFNKVKTAFFTPICAAKSGMGIRLSPIIYLRFTYCRAENLPAKI